MDIDETVQPRAEEELNTVPTPPIPSARTNSLAMAAFPWFNGSILTAGRLTDVVEADQLSIVSH